MNNLKRAAVFAAVFLSILPIPALKGEPQSGGDMPSLFKGLQSPSTTDQAVDQILHLAQSDARAREYTAKHLPAMIEKDPSSGFRAWKNAVVLAGELRIVEAAPALAKWLDIASSGVGGTSLSAGVDNFPAATALCRIGDAAIPALRTVLATGETVKRNYAIVTLRTIGSPEALNALRNHLGRETDPALRQRIEKALSN